MHFMQCWFIINVGNLWYFFHYSLMNKKLKKNSIYLKYNFCNYIHYRSKAWGQYLFFRNKLVFIQQGFVKLIETVIVKIDIVRKIVE